MQLLKNTNIYYRNADLVNFEIDKINIVIKAR